MTTSQQNLPAPATSNAGGDPELEQGVRDFVTSFSKLDPRCPNPEENAADELIALWLRRGWNLRRLRVRLKKEPPPQGWAETWAREIDYLFADHTLRLLERDRLRHEVGKLVRELNRKKNDPGIYQELVELGCEWRHDLKAFQACLRKANLEKSRVSEITQIVRSAATAREFVAGKLSVRRALFLARIFSRLNAPTPRVEPPTTETIVEPKRLPDGEDAAAGETEERWCKRLSATLKTLLKLTPKAKDQPDEDWQIQVGLYQLSFKPEAPRLKLHCRNHKVAT